MKFSVIFSSFLMVLIILVSMDANTPASASRILPGTRPAGARRLLYHSPQEDNKAKGLTVDKEAQVAGHGVASLKETQNSSMDVEEVIYTIDYHGATTHPTPTPKHPRP